MRPKIAISIGDINGIGPQLALEAHAEIARLCTPIYCTNKKVLENAAKELGLGVPEDIKLAPVAGEPHINAGTIDAKSGLYAFCSFLKAVALTKNRECAAMSTLPIHKEAWALANIPYSGHTDALRDIFDTRAVMVLGVPQMSVALFTEHIPLKEVSAHLTKPNLTNFLSVLTEEFKGERIAVLGLNPHAGDNGVMGDEERIIKEAMHEVNSNLSNPLLDGPFVPDAAFTKTMRANYNIFATMYHDQGLIPIKMLYFEEAVNYSINLPIIRTSVDHGTAFDIAYKGYPINRQSYINAIKIAADRALAKCRSGHRVF